MFGAPNWQKLGTEELVRRGQRGQPEALAELVRRYRSCVYDLACSLTDAVTAEDVTMDTVEVMCRDIRQLRNADSFGPWLLGIAFRICMSQIRKLQREAPAEAPLAAETEAAGDAVYEAVLAALLRECLREEVQQLPSAQGAAIMLYYYEGLSHREISKVTQRPENTVKSDLRRGLRRLKRKLLHNSWLIKPGSEVHDNSPE